MNTILGRCDISNIDDYKWWFNIKKSKSWLCQLTLCFSVTMPWNLQTSFWRVNPAKTNFIMPLWIVSPVLHVLSLLFSSTLDFPFSTYLFWFLLSASVSESALFSLLLPHSSFYPTVLYFLGLIFYLLPHVPSQQMQFHWWGTCLHLLGICFYLMHSVSVMTFEGDSNIPNGNVWGASAMPASEELHPWLWKIGKEPSLFFNINFQSYRILETHY